MVDGTEEIVNRAEEMRNGVEESDNESGGLSVVDIELTESISTGEVPSEVTFRYM